MARIAITTTTTTTAGIEPTYDTPSTAASPDGASVDNTRQRGVLHVKNADAAAHVVHIISQTTTSGLAVKDIVTSVPAGEERTFGPFSNATFGSSGFVHWDIYDASGPTFDASDDVSGGTKNSTSVTAAWIVPGNLS